MDSTTEHKDGWSTASQTADGVGGDTDRKRTKRYIGRKDLVGRLRQYSEHIIAKPICMVLYIEGGGGLGKTRLLEDYVELAEVAHTPIRACRLIDMVNPEQRDPRLLEQRIVDGLRHNECEHGLPQEEVDAAFATYRQATETFEQSFQSDVKRRDEAEAVLRRAFQAGWNTLSAKHPLVLRLDTLERLFLQNIPNDALPARPDVGPGVAALRDWLLKTLPELHHTLVLLCGRPPNSAIDAAVTPGVPANHPLAQDLLERGLLDPDTGFYAMHALNDRADIRMYLNEYSVNPGDDRILYIRQITEGSPLLLSLYAESQQPDSPSPFLASRDFAAVNTRADFERLLVNTILNPLTYEALANQEDTAQPSQRIQEKRILTLCLYVLSYARRGIRPDELITLLAELETPFELTEPLLNKLQGQVLVKKLRRPPHDGGDSVLVLHDEVWQLIDKSGIAEALGLKEQVLGRLCRYSADRVQMTSQVQDPVALVMAMTDHVSYALSYRFGEGYRNYLVYMDHLLAQRNFDHALVLADVFWRLLTLVVERPGGSVRIYHDLLAEAAFPDYTTIQRHDRVHYIKLLRARANYEQAAEEAGAMYDALVAEKVMPKLALLLAELPTTKHSYPLVLPQDQEDGQQSSIKATLPADPYLFATLALTWAETLTLAGRLTDTNEKVQQLCDAVIGLLQSPETLREVVSNRYLHNGDSDRRDIDLLWLHRNYLLGTAYRTRSQFIRQHQDYDQAIADAIRAVRAYREYEQKLVSDEPSHFDALVVDSDPDQQQSAADRLNDSVIDDLAFVQNNLAYTFLEYGNADGALRLSDTLLEEVIDKVIPYQQALIYNTHALIHLQMTNVAAAEQACNQALDAITRQLRPQGRVAGLVRWTQARLARAHMNDQRTSEERRAEIREEVPQYYNEAARLLQEEKDNHREVLHDHARYLRDLAFWYRLEGNDRGWQTSLENGLRLLDDALALLPPPPQNTMQRADLMETQLTMLVNLGRYVEGQALLDRIIPLMDEPMPLFGQIVSGTLALQHGLLLLRQHHDPIAALEQFAIALARALAFGARFSHYTTYQYLIKRWVANEIPADVVTRFVKTIRTDPFYITREDLPYQQHVLTARRWTESWEGSVQFFIGLGNELGMKAT